MSQRGKKKNSAGSDLRCEARTYHARFTAVGMKTKRNTGYQAAYISACISLYGP